MHPRLLGARAALASVIVSIALGCGSTPPPVETPPSAPANPPVNPPAPEDPAAQPESPDVPVLEAFVRTHAESVRRTCWSRQAAKPALVSVTVTVNVDGRVETVRASGAGRRMETCIEDDIRRWHFPSITKTLTVSVPFKFGH